MKICSNFNKINLNNVFKANKKAYPNLSPLKSDMFTFRGEIKEENPVEYENLKKYALSTGKVADEQIIRNHYTSINNYIEHLKQTGKSEAIIDEVKNIDKFKGKYSLEKYILYVAQLQELSDLFDRLEFAKIKKRAGISTNTTEELEFYPLARNLLIETGFNLPKDIDKYMQLAILSDSELSEMLISTKAHYMGIQIFSALNKKEDFPNYGLVLLSMAFDSGDKYSIGDFNPNEITDFLKSIGINDIYEIPDKYDYLASKYNGFYEIDDLINFINEAQQKYPEKIEFLTSLSKKFPDKFEKTDLESLKRLYSKRHDVLDYIISKQSTKSYEENLPFYIDFMVNFDKISEKTIKQIPETDNLKNTDSIYNFMEILTESKTTIDELNFMAQNSFVSDNSLFDCILYKNDIISKIANLKNISKNEANKIYINFANEYLALIQEAKKESNSDLFSGLFEKENLEEDFTRLLENYGLLDKINSQTGASLFKSP